MFVLYVRANVIFKQVPCNHYDIWKWSWFSNTECIKKAICYSIKPPAPQDILLRVITMFYVGILAVGVHYTSGMEKKNRRKKTHLSLTVFWCWLFWRRTLDPCSTSHIVSPLKMLPWDKDKTHVCKTSWQHNLNINLILLWWFCLRSKHPVKLASGNGVKPLWWD